MNNVQKVTSEKDLLLKNYYSEDCRRAFKIAMNDQICGLEIK